MRQFVDQRQLRTASEHRSSIHLRQHPTSMPDITPRHHLQPINQLLGRSSAMRLDEADHAIDALPALATTFEQHLVGLAYSRSST